MDKETLERVIAETGAELNDGELRDIATAILPLFAAKDAEIERLRAQVKALETVDYWSHCWVGDPLGWTPEDTLKKIADLTRAALDRGEG